ncbi:MAG: hypothetical protein AAF725_14785 [Acidobacteriota bacterium]
MSGPNYSEVVLRSLHALRFLAESAGFDLAQIAETHGVPGEEFEGWLELPESIPYVAYSNIKRDALALIGKREMPEDRHPRHLLSSSYLDNAGYDAEGTPAAALRNSPEPEGSTEAVRAALMTLHELESEDLNNLALGGFDVSQVLELRRKWTEDIADSNDGNPRGSNVEPFGPADAPS